MIETKAISVHGQGQRANQEDGFYPDVGEKAENLFLVCDGVGGAEKGEIASQLAIKSVTDFFRDNPKKSIDETFVQEAIAASQKAIQSFLQENPQAQGMGTTLTLLHVGDDKLTVAHIGDSRIYHFRGGTILWQSTDHSWVNEMLERGLLTEEQAKDHSRQNVITRALQGELEKEVTADVHEILDVQKDDTFMLCSDGVLESFTEEMLCEMMKEQTTLSEKANAIDLICSQNSKDNYTAWLIKVIERGSVEVYEARPISKSTPLVNTVKSLVNDLFKK